MAPSPQLFAKLVGNAFTIAVVGFAIAISLGKIFALRHGYRVDSNQVWGMGSGTCWGNLVYKGPQVLGGWSMRWDTGRQQTGVLTPCGGLREGQQNSWASKVFGGYCVEIEVGDVALLVRSPHTCIPPTRSWWPLASVTSSGASSSASQ